MKEVKEMLTEILANQMVIYKRLEQIEYKIKGGLRLAPDKTYVEELKKQANKFKKYLETVDLDQD